MFSDDLVHVPTPLTSSHADLHVNTSIALLPASLTNHANWLQSTHDAPVRSLADSKSQLGKVEAVDVPPDAVSDDMSLTLPFWQNLMFTWHNSHKKWGAVGLAGTEVSCVSQMMTSSP